MYLVSENIKIGEQQVENGETEGHKKKIKGR